MQAYICNTGIISAIGMNTQEQLENLKKAKHGISMPTYLNTSHQLPVGEIKLDNEALRKLADVDEDIPRTALLSIIAAKEAWEPFKDISETLKIGLISSNTVGGMDITERNYENIKTQPESFDYTKISNHECGNITNLTAKYLGLNCFTATISTACSSSANTIMLASKMIKSGHLDVCIVGGADSLSLFTLNGFNALMILDKELCQPFDQHRRGLNLGEGAAYLVLANEKAMKQWNLSSDTIVSGYANANDAHHQTASSPEGLGNQEAMLRALTTAGLQPSDIDYINLHGTGTENNDSSESKAITKVFPKVPLCSTTKGFTGHTLGAAGAIEAVFSYLSIKENMAWGCLRITNHLTDIPWNPITENTSSRIQHVLSNSFGFGGNCSSIILSKVNK